MTDKQDMLLDNAEADSLEKNVAALPEDEQRENRIAWWREARIGLFIHWGLYSELGGYWNGAEVEGAYGEHIMLRGKIPVAEYEEVAKRFDPVRFSADEWVAAAKDAGLKYIVVTAKHHDGFAMYDSKACDFNIVKRTPFGRDPMKELAAACEREGIRLCFYYSHAMDWHHPDSQGNTWDYPANIGAYDPLESWIGDEDKRSRYERYLEQKAYPQVTELLTGYGPVGIVWFDYGHKITDEQGTKFVNLVHGLQPGCLVNRRVRRDGFGDYGNSGDNQLHVRVRHNDWESIATLNDSWGYKRSDRNWKTARDLVRNMIDVASQNGNFLINVGPTGEGVFDPKSVELLREIGLWMKQNGDSIYGTTASPIGKLLWGRCTAKGRTLYFLVWDQPAHGELLVPGIRSRIGRAYAIADPDKRPLPVKRLNEDDIALDVHGVAFDPICTVIVLELAEDIDANPLRRLFGSGYSNVFEAFDGEIHGRTLRYDTGKKGRDNVTDWSDVSDWIEWEFRAASSGRYRVDVSYGSTDENAGGTFTVSAGNGCLLGKVEATGGEHRFATRELGFVYISAPGTYRLTVRATAIPGRCLMNLCAVTLTAHSL
ncbi:alpha-L-fucosidase [Paenibacillus ginsengarvi]|uniref:alpha-L-fucosidase n=1 Tax=Paenibacillus ginsengarvi TaxID=400777 RepID=A0A3B0ANT5_9BACL|nr:alpha-L-fucosidase [Paenibacillus ginsengarvi]RKN62082.1 alpha-L-fucosidase [Paenibacillus ginsengarvi]